MTTIPQLVQRLQVASPTRRAAQLRVRVARLLQRLLLGQWAGGLPANALRSIEEASLHDELRAHVADQRQLLPPLAVTYALPPELPPAFRRTKAFEARRGYLLRDVCVSAASGLAWLPDAPFVLAESVGCVHRLMGWANLMPELLVPVPALPESEPVVVCPPGPFFHWLFETLPNLLLALEHWPTAHILLPATYPPFIDQALRHLLSPTEYATRLLRATGPRRVSELVLISKDEMAGFVHPADIERLRRAFLPPTEPVGQPAEVLYVSRVRTANRAVRGEQALETALRARGFTIVYAEELSLTAQIARFAGARLIVGLHGAGLSHVVWASAPAQVAEIFPAGYFNDCYARLSSSMGFGYAPFFCGSRRSGFDPTADPLPVADILAWLDGLSAPVAGPPVTRSLSIAC